MNKFAQIRPPDVASRGPMSMGGRGWGTMSDVSRGGTRRALYSEVQCIRDIVGRQ